MVSLEPKQAATPAGVDARWQLEQRRRFGGVSVEGEGVRVRFGGESR
jgi:hypothetical protein